MWGAALAPCDAGKPSTARVDELVFRNALWLAERALSQRGRRGARLRVAVRPFVRLAKYLHTRVRGPAVGGCCSCILAWQASASRGPISRLMGMGMPCIRLGKTPCTWLVAPQCS